MTALHAPAISRLRRLLRGLPYATMITTLEDALEGLAVSALAADNSGRYIAVNERASTLTGYSRGELLGMSVKDLTPAMSQDRTAGLWSRFIQTGAQAGDYVLERKDGAPVSVHYAAFASVAPGVHISLLTPHELTSSI